MSTSGIAPWSCDCHLRWASSKFIYFSFELFGKLSPDAIQLYSDVVLGDAENCGHLYVAQSIEMHQDERRVQFGKFMYGIVKAVDQFVIRLTVGGSCSELQRGCVGHILLVMSNSASLGPSADKRRVQRDSINPRGLARSAPEVRNRQPDSEQYILKQIVSVSWCISERADDLQHQARMITHPTLKDGLLFVDAHQVLSNLKD
jgi:hypothetical protein